MNPHTGELRGFELGQDMPEGFEPVPEELEPAAKKKLAGRNMAMVSLTSGGKLSRWAASKRRKAKGIAKGKRRHNRSFHG